MRAMCRHLTATAGDPIWQQTVRRDPPVSVALGGEAKLAGALIYLSQLTCDGFTRTAADAVARALEQWSCASHDGLHTGWFGM